MEMEALTAEGALITKDRRRNAQPESVAADRVELKRESLIASQAAVDTPSVVGSASGQTLDDIVWSFGEPLTQLGENWLGNPFTALASLIQAPFMTDVTAFPQKETMEHMLYHFTNINTLILCSKCITCFPKDLHVPI